MQTVRSLESGCRHWDHIKYACFLCKFAKKGILTSYFSQPHNPSCVCKALVIFCLHQSTIKVKSLLLWQIDTTSSCLWKRSSYLVLECRLMSTREDLQSYIYFLFHNFYSKQLYLLKHSTRISCTSSGDRTYAFWLSRLETNVDIKSSL